MLWDVRTQHPSEVFSSARYYDLLKSRQHAISPVPGTHSVLLALAVVLRRCAPHRRSSAGIAATGVDPGVGSDEPVISAVTAGAVMPNQEARAARRAVRDIGADKLNHHGRSKRVHRGRRARRGRPDVPRNQDAYLNLRVAEPHRRSALGPVRASTPGEHRRASLLSWT